MLEVARRFLRAYAPATADDFRRWWAIGEPQARRRLQALDVEQVEVAGEPAYVLADDADALLAPSPTTRSACSPASTPG